MRLTPRTSQSLCHMSIEINNQTVPSELAELLRAGQWINPGRKAMRQMFRGLRDPVDFVKTVDQMRQESGEGREPLPDLRETRSSMSGYQIDLPWIDLDFAICIATTLNPGDDVGIFIDYRSSKTDPRVIYTEWTRREGCLWREAFATFGQFLGEMNRYKE